MRRAKKRWETTQAPTKQRMRVLGCQNLAYEKGCWFGRAVKAQRANLTRVDGYLEAEKVV